MLDRHFATLFATAGTNVPPKNFPEYVLEPATLTAKRLSFENFRVSASRASIPAGGVGLQGSATEAKSLIPAGYVWTQLAAHR
ncbi:hypothetical protein LshimejAT787_0210390 [Lyophyllum shimeji]|uniref:Uncharacterized protein n=1 Tax=Lyophyllum shimeji TaxID=47721 RepID=A0A9P3PHD0_LYOSH|nr:hypothetical protein LshimejAT787_0210390 [Lyophyllum shimeji]